MCFFIAYIFITFTIFNPKKCIMKNFYLFSAILSGFFSFSQTIGVQVFASGFNAPVEIANAGDTRMFIIEQGGKIRILNANGSVLTTPFLNLTTATISTGGERGLLGLAFHPNYVSNGYFYVNYTNTAGSTVIARYSVSTSNLNIANVSSATILLTIPQPFTNHNGGTIRFGPDGYLYIGMGDGGSGGDPGNRAQNKNLLLGKMLRIDVDNGLPYQNPATNPYVGIAGADEIWAIGMRNPWKFSFDNADGSLWTADVGQSEFEEINKVSALSLGLNYGWKCYEGTLVYTQNCVVAGTTYTFPIAQYSHSDGSCSVTGGYVYRGTTYPNFVGKYFFADFCKNRIGYVNSLGTIFYSNTFTGDNNFSTFGLDVNNELYVASIYNGIIYKLVDLTLKTEDFNSSGIGIFPNPAQTNFSVQSSSTAFPLEIQVFDMSGKRLISAAVEDNKKTIAVSHLEKGIYLVQITSKNGAITNQKLMIE
jgi:glucose/arabinose dehydrogenase